MIDVLALLADDDDPEYDHEVIPLYDPDRPPRWFMPGTRRGSGPDIARKRIWQITCAMRVAYIKGMLESDHKVLTVILDEMAKRRTDQRTLAIRVISETARLPHSTTVDAIARLVEDGWLVIVERGIPIDPTKPGQQRRATVYGLPRRPPSSPPSRRPSVRVNELGGRPKADPDQVASISPTTKLHSNQEPIGTRVSVRATEARDTLEISGVDPACDTLEIPAKDWLRDRLARGPEMTSIVVAEGIAAGYSRRTIYRAAKALGVVSTYLQGFADGYGKPPPHVTQWGLP